MSRLSDLLNPAPPSATKTQDIETTQDKSSRSKSHHRNQSITSPLEALAIVATTGYAEPGLTNLANPSPFQSASTQLQNNLEQPLSTAQTYPYHAQSSEPAMRQISYSLYNQPTSPNLQWRASTNGVIEESHAPCTEYTEDKSAEPIEVNGVEQQDAEQMSESKDRTEVVMTQLKQEDERLENDALSREANLTGSEKKAESEDQTRCQEEAISAIKQEEIQTPTAGASSPSAAPSPITSTVKGAKSRPKQKPEKKKTNSSTTKKPAAKKRKIEVDSRGDTPLSHRSGTPHSNHATKSSAPRNGKVTPATPAQSSPPPAEEEADEEDSESDNELFCICRKPDDHTWMIGCDGGCEDWFHGRCVNMSQKDETLIDKYICPNCTSTKGIQTTWKPMCRLEGCRNPARSGGPNPSKYCCDEHGIQFMRQAVMNRAIRDTQETRAKKRRKENYTDNVGNEGETESPHLRGGHLLPTEVKGLASAVNNIQDFKSLGDSVPGLANFSAEANEKKENKLAPMLTTSEIQEIEGTKSKRAKLRHQLEALDDKERFLLMVKSRRNSVLEELKKKEKSMKDICGFDRRLRWSLDDFDQWRLSPPGRDALKSGVLTASTLDNMDADGDAKMTDGIGDGAEEIGKGVCQKKRCKQHEGWYKLHSQDLAFDKLDCRRAMQKLDIEEKGIRERAVIRSLESEGGV